MELEKKYYFTKSGTAYQNYWGRLRTMDAQVNFQLLDEQLATENAQLKALIEQLTAEIEQLKTANEHLRSIVDSRG